MTYVGLITMFLVLVSVLPTVAVAELTFRWSLAHEMDKEAMHLQREWRTRSAPSATTTIEPDGGWWRIVRQPDDVYPSRAFKTEMKTNCPRGQSRS